MIRTRNRPGKTGKAIFPSTSRANVADFLLDSAADDTFFRKVVVVTDTK
jgi:hypothetical protein